MKTGRKSNRADSLRQEIRPVPAMLVVELDGPPREGVPCMVKVTIEMDEVQLLLIALALAKLVLTATRQR